MLTGDELVGVVGEMFSTMMGDRGKFSVLRDYHGGRQQRPRLPVNVDPTLPELVDRSTVNLMRLAVNIPAQLSFVEGFSHVGRDGGGESVELNPAEWYTWIESGFSASQTNVWRTSLKYGQAFVLVDTTEPGEPRLRLLPTASTVAFFDDPVNDRVPMAALTAVTDRHGVTTELVYYDDAQIVRVPIGSASTVFNKSWFDSDDVTVEEHGLGVCPVVRFVCELDDEGRTVGVVEPLIEPQDRVNQTAFDLLMTQTYGAFQVRWAAGLAGDPMLDENGDPIKDENGFIVYKPFELSQERLLLTDKPDAKFGTLDATPVDGFIAALENAVKSFAVMGNIPPHSLLGSMNNLSGETIEAAMGQTNRFTHMLRNSWGESVKELMRLVRVAKGLPELDGMDAQVRWREMSDQSMAQIVDALGKASQMLGVPGRGLWSRIPNTDSSDLRKWDELAGEDAVAAEFDTSDVVAQSGRERASLSLFASTGGGRGNGDGDAASVESVGSGAAG